MTQLIVFRGAQGLAGGVLTSTVFTVISQIFPPAERGRIQGVFSGIFGLASIVGPLLGGYLTDNLSWRWVFYVNVPVGLLAIVVVFLTLASVRHSASWRDIDFAGAFTLAATLVPLLIALSITRDHEFTSPEVIGLLLIAALMGVIFFVIERRDPHPVVPFDLWKNPTFAVSTAIGFLLGFAMFGAILFVGLVYQGVLGIPATNSGLLITPLMVGLIVASLITGQLMVRMRRYRYLGTVGAVLLVIGLYLLSQVTVGSPEIEVVRDLVLVGLGVGVGMPLYLNATQSAVDPRYLGVVSSQIQFWRNIGSTVGVAILGAVLSHELTQKIVASIPPQFAGAIPANGNAQAIFDPAVIQRIPPRGTASSRPSMALTSLSSLARSSGSSVRTEPARPRLSASSARFSDPRRARPAWPALTSPTIPPPSARGSASCSRIPRSTISSRRARTSSFTDASTACRARCGASASMSCFASLSSPIAPLRSSRPSPGA